MANEVAVNQRVVNETGCFMVADSGHATYCSIVANTPEERKRVFNAVNTPDKVLRDYINKTINLRDVFAEQCNFVDRESGEVKPGVRIVLIDDEGVSYSTSSTGIFTGLSKLFNIYGTPDCWTEPVPITIKQISRSAKQAVLVFEIV